MSHQDYLLSDIEMGEEEAQAVADVVRSKWLSVGPRTAAFEAAFADAMGADFAVALSSCTAALHLALLACEIGPGDEVLVPSYTFVASVNAIRYVGATPVFVDIAGPHDLNLCVANAASKITGATKAILPVHFAGYPVDMDRLAALADEYDLAIIEDACHAIGASYHGHENSPYRGLKAGALGDAGCFSFFANKNMVTGEGGMLCTNDAELARRVRLARSHGMTKTSWDKASGRATGYDVEQIGFNYRCTELTAALGIIQLAKLQRLNAKRRLLVARYRELLGEVAELTLPFVPRLDDSAHHIFPVLLCDAAQREAFREALKQRGVQSSVHYPPVHHFSHYAAHYPQAAPLTQTDDVAAREVTLPLHPLLSDDDIAIICRHVQDALMEVRSTTVARVGA